MNQEEFDFMRLPQKPKRMSCQQTGWYMGFNEREIKILIQKKLLKPLGKPAPNAGRYFSRLLLDKLGEDPKWLDRACEALGQHWRERNELDAQRRQSSPRQTHINRKVKGILDADTLDKKKGNLL